MVKEYDVIIVGGGHNGLTAGCYLQKSGKKVLVLERLEKAGGGVWTEEVTSEQMFTHGCNYIMKRFDEEFKNALNV